MRYFVQLKEKMRNHLDGEERAGCFAWFVFMVPRYGAGALPRSANGLSAVSDCGKS